jgi:pimeloyl-ACP methyl ester carboxylesterase
MRLRFLMPAALLFAAAGCDSALTTKPVDRIPADESIVDAATARAALVGAYDGLQALSYYGRTFLVLNDLSADNAEHVGTFQYLGQVDRNQLQADNTSVTNTWVAIYDAVARVNLLLQKVPDVTGLTDAQKNQILGEGHFLRALHYHNLVKLWGDVPMPLEPLESPADAAALTRTPRAQVYTQILADLTQAEQLMTTARQPRQASLGAARALRARVMLYAENWQGALDAANAVQAMGYSLAPLFESLFTDEGTDTPEDVFRVSFTATEYNEMGYYYLFDGRWETAPTADLYAAYAANDRRRAITVAEDDGDYEGTKFPTTIGAEDLHVIRFAEVLLTKAEALARLNRLGEAVTEYNKIRVRAGLAPHVLGTDVTTQAQVLAAGGRIGTMTAVPALVLLHGLGRTRFSLWPVAREAQRRGYHVHNLGYPSRRAPIERLADDVGARIRALAGDAPVDVVTHSMGGIVLRAAVASGSLPADRVRRVVMLAPPNHGSELADRLRDYLAYRLATGPAGQQIGTSPESVPRRLPPPPFEVGIIAGRRSNNPLFANVLGAESDGKVTVASARVDGMRDLVVVDRSHTFLMWAPDVLAHTFAFLESGRFVPRAGQLPRV